jgi:hypothetical protein
MCEAKVEQLQKQLEKERAEHKETSHILAIYKKAEDDVWIALVGEIHSILGANYDEGIDEAAKRVIIDLAAKTKEINELKTLIGERYSHPLLPGVIFPCKDDARAFQNVWDNCENAETKLTKLQEGLKQIKHIDANGCLSGDCPHDQANDCLTILIKELQLVGETIRNLIGD